MAIPTTRLGERLARLDDFQSAKSAAYAIAVSGASRFRLESARPPRGRDVCTRRFLATLKTVRR